MADKALSPREFISKAMADAKTMFDVFDAIVGRMESDTAKIAKLEAELFERRKGELVYLMSEISEDHWAAGWMHYNEYALWAMVIDPAKRMYGMREVPESQIARLKQLSEQIDGWIAYRVDPFSPGADIQKGEEFIPMAEWLEMFAKHEAVI